MKRFPDKFIDNTVALEDLENRNDTTSDNSGDPQSPLKTLNTEKSIGNSPSAALVEAQLGMNDDDIITLQGCPQASLACCDTLNLFADILSPDGDDDFEYMRITSISQNKQTSFRSSKNPRPFLQASSNSDCLTPRSDQECQRRGRFLIWPSALSNPALGQAGSTAPNA